MKRAKLSPARKAKRSAIQPIGMAPAGKNPNRSVGMAPAGQAERRYLIRHGGGGPTRPKPIPAPSEDSLSPRRTKALARKGWDYRGGKWWPPGSKKPGFGLGTRREKSPRLV